MTPSSPPSAAEPAVTLTTTRGPIAIYSHAPEALIAPLTIDAGFGAVFRVSRTREELIRIARRDDGNVVLAVAEAGLMVGYVALERPVPVAWQQRVMQQRWAECEAIVELAAMEVSRNFRRLRLAEGMLQVIAGDPSLQDKIVIASALRRYWDLAGSGMDARQYRDALLHLLSGFGYTAYPTSDREVISDPTNALVAWFGPQARADDIALFHELRVRL